VSEGDALVVPRTDSTKLEQTYQALFEVEGCLESSFFGEKSECFVIIETGSHKSFISHHVPFTFQRTTF